MLTPEQRNTINDIFHEVTAPGTGIDGVMAAVGMWDENPGLYEAMHTPDPVTGLTPRNPGPDPQRMFDKYSRKVQGAAQDWTTGMQNPKANFRDAAIAAKGKWADGVSRAVRNDNFGRGMAAVDVAEAIATATSDRGQAYTAGVAKRSAKIQRVMNRLAPALGAVSSQIRQMPQDTEGDRTARMVQNLELMRQLKGRLKGAGA